VFGDYHGFGSRENVENGKNTAKVIYGVTYFDIFGKGHVTPECSAYQPRTKTWIRCTNLIERK